MLIDTHCHINMLIKETFDVPLTQEQLDTAQSIINSALQHHVSTIINVGTSLTESKNCIELAQRYKQVYAAIGIHPNDCTPDWKHDFQELKKLAKNKEALKIVAVGETGLDRHYPGYDIARQTDAFKAHIELALEHDLAIIVHTRDAHDEVLTVLDIYKRDNPRTVIHCFSEDLSFAQHAIANKFFLGIGGTLTYPKNNALREVFAQVPLEHIVLETDAPFLPPQSMRGKKNAPRYIYDIAQFLADLKQVSFEAVAKQTTANAKTLFKL